MAVTTKKEDVKPTELEMLQAQADIMGIPYRNGITVKALRKELLEALTDDVGEELTNTKRSDIEREATKLIRCIVTPMASNMKEHQGQLFAVGNAVLPVIAKYILFNAEYHVPQIILDHIKAQELQYFVTAKVSGRDVRVPKMRKAFSVEILDPLTDEELKELARSQENRNAVDA